MVTCFASKFRSNRSRSVSASFDRSKKEKWRCVCIEGGSAYYLRFERGHTTFFGRRDPARACRYRRRQSEHSDRCCLFDARVVDFVLREAPVADRKVQPLTEPQTP
jgi:hypothetical protein